MTEDELRTRAPSQYRVLAFIKAEIAAGYPFPSHDAIAHHMNWKHSSNCASSLHWLTAEGFLERESTSRYRNARYAYRLKHREAA